ncbi:MAG: hypothetical protein CWE10_13845 [Symbiobacterium thermophilum]|uniref:Uncharacterized protein n=2 Tax=Symbiobacterium thermophilum TaxID=2734 RepID=A0A953IF14_SYMTR|nr:hypothetical protein [Symbiobacterium thermophilum]
MARVGRRGKRLRSADRRQERATHQLPCVCGCNAGPGEISRAHIIGRAYESVRNEDWNNLPACWWLHRWLDSEPEGIRCKRSLHALAVGLGRRLEAGDVQPLLRECGYYDWRRRAGGGGP